MPRRKLAFLPGHYYHIYNRGVDKRPIFHEADNYIFLLHRLKKYALQFQITVIAYCLMPNHYHFLLRQDNDQSISIFMQRVFNSYTKAFNKRYHRSGPLFAGRYKAKHVADDQYLLHLCRYIHANPVKDGFVTAPEEWQYGNYLEWIGEREGTLIDREFVSHYYPNPAEYAADVRAYLLGKTDLPQDIQDYLKRIP
ncbi:MAG: transposase [Chloroflexi bacterium]|nr:transposase [Chloroflexota bacterium]